MTPKALLYSILGLFALATFAFLYAAGLTVSVDGVPRNLPAMILSSLLCAHIYRSRDIVWASRLINALECVSLLALISLIGGVASYALAALSTGWKDGALLAADAALGLDWVSYWTFVQHHGLVKLLLDYGYFSIFSTPAILLIILAATGKEQAAYRFLIAYALALILTDLIFPFVPGKSAAEHFLPAGTANMPMPGLLHIPIIEQLRAGATHQVNLAQLGGLIAFPSFHAASACLFAWAGWQDRWFRVPCFAINFAMLLATPIQGGHYFIDTLGGMVVAAFAIYAVKRLYSVKGPRLAANPQRPMPARPMLPQFIARKFNPRQAGQAEAA
jgi:membrane-associated phospholipid phosphatase